MEADVEGLGVKVREHNGSDQMEAAVETWTGVRLRRGTTPQSAAVVRGRFPAVRSSLPLVSCLHVTYKWAKRNKTIELTGHKR